MPHFSWFPLQSLYRGRTSNQSQVGFVGVVGVVMTKLHWVEEAEQCYARNTGVKK